MDLGLEVESLGFSYMGPLQWSLTFLKGFLHEDEVWDHASSNIKDFVDLSACEDSHKLVSIEEARGR